MTSRLNIILRLLLILFPLTSLADNTPLEGFENKTYSITFNRATTLKASDVFGTLVGDSQIILDRYRSFSDNVERCTLSAADQDTLVIPQGTELKLSGPYSEHISVPFPYFLVEGLATGPLTLRCSVLNKEKNANEWATQLPVNVLEKNNIKVDKK